jgi:hypothetical protein
MATSQRDGKTKLHWMKALVVHYVHRAWSFSLSRSLSNDLGGKNKNKQLGA